MDAMRARQGRLVAGIGGLLLFGFLFLPWFSAGDLNESGWEGQSSTDIYLLITAMVAVASALPASRAMLLPGVTMAGAAALLGAVASVLLIWLSFIDVPSGEGREVGIYLALVAALVITVGGYMATQVPPATARART
jgi:Na+/H+ antiporter NhaA